MYGNFPTEKLSSGNTGDNPEIEGVNYMTDFFKFLDTHQIAYERYDHPAVFTVEEADRLVPKLPGAKTKNLFLRDGKGKRHFLVLVRSDKRVNLKELKNVFGIRRIRFASATRLKKHLGVEPGAVSLLAIYNDVQQHAVEVVMDSDLWGSESFLFHPLVNTSTLVISRADIQRFVEATGHEMMILTLCS